MRSPLGHSQERDGAAHSRDDAGKKVAQAEQSRAGFFKRLDNVLGLIQYCDRLSRTPRVKRATCSTKGSS
jgi:hypothetical protein